MSTSPACAAIISTFKKDVVVVGNGAVLKIIIVAVTE